MNHTKHTKLKWLAAMLAMPIAIFAQETQKELTTYFSNALFNTLLVIIILLLIVLMAVANVLKNLSQSEYFQERYKKDKLDTNNNTSKTLGLLVVFGLLTNQVMAENTKGNASNDWLIGGLDGFTFYFMMFVIFLEGISIFLLLNVIKGLTKSDKVKSVKVIEASDGKVIEVKEKTILDKLNASVDIDKEAEIMLDHDYDGIKELDNNLPPWWKYGFYLTILIGVIYLVNYHISGTGDLQEVEYNKEIAAAKIQIEEYMKTSANNVDETTVKLLTDSKDIEAGKAVFMEFNCKQCHGIAGEGNSVGPNLTDAYWLHNGGIADLFKTIKYGWPDKGMKSWKEDLSPIQIAQVASYIKSLAGTNPPNAKAPQGDLYVEQGAKVPTDSTAVVTDSLAVKDSLNVKK
ncbi:MAG: cbb3-type cytochrome c oxidase N-terminal domain-containing protein [Bacteroidota bacterium]|nr:cbb3-type cytochrome c oxidase N-terminal domain-containing protein [Bacteroidota bacterium]